MKLVRVQGRAAETPAPSVERAPVYATAVLFNQVSIRGTVPTTPGT
jgi:hypothetical protein